MRSFCHTCCDCGVEGRSVKCECMPNCRPMTKTKKRTMATLRLRFRVEEEICIGLGKRCSYRKAKGGECSTSERSGGGGVKGRREGMEGAVDGGSSE
jgi:hypothetical protein